MDDNSNSAGATSFDADRPIFEALLTPYRSLGPLGFAITMAMFGSICLGAGLVFIANGAWPVFGFLGLDVLILFIAFKMSYRTGRASEEVSVSRNDVAIRKISPRGQVKEAHYLPAWTKFRIKRKEEMGIQRMDVASQGRSTEIGAFLHTEDRESFAKAFNEALGQAKRG